MSGNEALPTNLKILKGVARECGVSPNEGELTPAPPEPLHFLGRSARDCTPCRARGLFAGQARVNQEGCNK